MERKTEDKTAPSPRQGVSPSLIFLIGYRGTGKTTVARLLAKKLDWNWIDADAYLEARYGLSIRTLIEQEGENGFRDKETEVLEQLCRLCNSILATGGGVVLKETNRQRMRAAGRVVWLTAEPATIWQRLQRDPTTPERRPALAWGGLAEVEEALQTREPLYRACADITVDTTGRSPEEVTRAILEHGKLD